MAKVIHSMVRVLDLERTLRFYADVLDMHESHRLDFPDFALVYVRNAENDMEIEFTLNKGRTEAYTHGTGYGHIALAVENAYAACDAIRARGGKVTREAGPMKGGSTVIAFVEDPDGYKIELIEKKP